VSASELRELLAEATALVDAAAELVRRRLRDDVAFRRKADRTLVSAIDLEVEAMLRGEIARRFPGDGVLGEEEGRSGENAERRWVIDPIDGTRSLRHRIPLFGTLVAVQRRRAGTSPAPTPGTDDADPWETVVGVVALPALSRVYGAAREIGAFRDGAPFVQAAPVEDGFDEEVVSLGERRQFVNAGRPEVFDRIVGTHPGARVYPDCFAHVLAAEGAVGAMVDFDLRPWDIAATRVLVEEAGGRCVEVGRRAEGDVLRVDVVLGKPGVVEQVVRLL